MQKITNQHPVPVVMCFGSTQVGSAIALKSLEYGLADVLQKPGMGSTFYQAESRIVICAAVEAAAMARLVK